MESVAVAKKYRQNFEPLHKMLYIILLYKLNITFCKKACLAYYFIWRKIPKRCLFNKGIYEFQKNIAEVKISYSEIWYVYIQIFRPLFK